MQREIMKCMVPMWLGGCPSGHCGNDAYGVYIDGPTFRDGWTGEIKRMDGKWRGYTHGPCCPKHGGPDKFGPRVYQDGMTEKGRPMWCAVYEDFEDLQESPAEFHEHPWIAIALLEMNHPRKKGANQ